MKKNGKSKFIIGLSTAVMGGILATGQTAYASDAPAIDEQLNTNNIVDDSYVDYTLFGDNDAAGVEKATTTDEANLPSEDKETGVDQGALVEEPDTNQELNQTLEEVTDLTGEDKAEATNEKVQIDSAENTDQAFEATSGEEALLTEPSATTEDSAPVEEAEEPSTETTAEEDPATEADENLDIEIDAGVVIEDGADTANAEADTVDKASTKNIPASEANTVDTTNQETAAANSTEIKDDDSVSAGGPQETPAADGPLKKSLQAGDGLLDGDSLPITEGGSELPEIDNGAESSAGDDIAVKKADTDPEADAAKIENKRETDLTPGDTAVIGGKDDLKDPKDGFKLEVVEPTTANPDKRLYGYELIIDKETGQRTYTWIQVSSSVVRSSPTRLGTKLKKIDMPMIEVGDKLSESLPEVTYKATGPSTLESGSQNVYGYKASKEDLEHINNKDNNSTVLGMKDYYTQDNVNGPHVLDNASFEFKVNPWPDENDNLEPIRLQGNYDKNKKVYVHGQEIDTGLKVENLDANARDRLTAKVYNTENGEIVPGAEVYIDAEGNVKVKLPDGAVDTDGKINPNSIFYKDPNFIGAQSLDVKLYARPRTAGEFQNVAAGDDDSYNPYKVKGTYVETGAGTTTITHKGEAVTIANQGIDRYDHYNLIGEFEINLDDESNYDIVTKDLTAGKIVTDKMLRLKAGVDKEIEQVDNPNSTAPHKYTTALTDKAVDSYLEPEYEEFLIPVEGEENKYRTTDNWLVEVDPDDPQNMKVSTPIGAKKGENLTLAITHLFTNGSEKNFLINYVVREESIEKPDYEVAVTEAGQKVDNTPTNEYTESKPKPVKYELESTSIVDANGKTWTLSIDEKTGVITAKAPAEIVDRVSTINAPVIATYEDQRLTDKDGNKLVYTERSNAAFTATAPQEGEVTYSQDNIIEYETIVRNNPEKDPTQSGVVQEGKNGKYTVDYKVTYKNGEVVEGPTMVEGSERDRVEPIPQIFEIGTKGASVDVTAPDEQTIKIPYTTEIIYDANQPVGYRKETPGEDGEKKITYEIIQENGKATVEATETTIKEVTPRRIIIGTKPSELGVDFNPEIDVKVDNTKDVGSVDTEVVQGEYKTVTKNVQNPDGSIVTIEEVVEITKPKQIITVGTKDYTGDVSHTDKKDVPFEVKYEYTDQLDAGVTELKNDGVLGEKTVTYTVPVINGKKDPNKEITSEETQTKNPVDKVILVGTRPVEKTIEIPFETEYVYDSNLEVGQTVTDENNPGVTGQKKVTTSFNQTTNDIVVTEETVTEAQKRIVRVGGKTTGKEVITEDIAFNTRVEYDPSLKKGEWKYKVVDGVEQKGVAGVRKITVNIENSVATSTTEQVTAPVDAVILVGSEDFTGNISHDVTEALPYNVKVEYDPTMKAGEYKVETEGKAGSKTTRYSYEIKNGDVVNQNPETTVIEEKTVDPTTQVIKVGTKVLGDTPEKESNVPVNVKFTPTDTIAQGTAIKGEYTPGKVVDKVVSKYNPETGKIESTITPEVTPAELEILVGTQAYTGEFSYVERRNIPHETTIKFDDTLAAGETRVDQEGVNGVEERKITQSFTNGTLSAQNVPETFNKISDPTNKVVSVGTMRNGEVVHKEAIPFEVEVKYDPSLKAGEYKYETDADGNEKKGVAGEQEITYTIVNSEVTETSEANITRQPEKAVILVGNKDFEGTVSHEVTREVPFEVEIEYDDTLKAGEYKVTQQGELGSETTKYEFNIKNGEAVDETPTTTIVDSKSKAPVKQIVKVGRKPAENTNDFSSEIGIDVKFVADETKEQGSQPETSYTPGTVVNKVVSKYDPVTGQIVTTTEPQVTKGVIEIKYGTKDYTGEVKYIEKEYIDYSTKVTVDYSLKPNEVVVDTKGQVGIKERNVTQKVVNGKLTDTARDEYKTTIQPVEQVIRIGVNVTAEKPQDTTIEIPFDTRIVYDETKPLGYSNIDTEGQNGSVTITFSEEIKDGKVTVTASEDKKDPTTQVVTIGTKAIENVTGSDEEVIEPKVVIEYSDQLEQGKIETNVTNGKANANSDSSYNGDDGTISNNTDVEVTQPTITVTVGTKPINKTKTEEIPFETEYVFDPTLDVGQQETQTEGQNGSRTITFERTSDGTTIIEKEIEVKVTEPTKKVVRVGTKQTVTTEEIETPYATVVEYDDTKPVGEKDVIQGIPGKKTVTVTTAIDKDGKVVTSTKENVVSEATDEKVIIGTKVTNGQGQTTTKVVGVPFEVEVIEDDTLAQGTIIKEQTGVAGERTITVKTPVTNGVAGEPIVTDEVTTQPTNQIIRVGTKPVVDKENTVSKEVNTVIKYVYDDTLEIGKTIEGDFTPGKVETKVVSEFDEKTGQIVTREETTVTPGTKTITIGTKPSETKTTVDIPFEIETILDDTIPAGQQKVEAGQKGEKEITITKTIVDGQPQINKVEKVTKDAKNQVVRIGTKVEKLNDSTEKSITVDQPFDTEIIYDNSINAGDVVVEKEGENGTRTIVAKTTVKDGVIQDPEVTSSITTEPTNKVIRIGTKAPDARTEKIPFDTIVEHDPTLPAGTRLEVPGVEGEKTISYTTKVENGKITTTSEEQVTKEPKAKKVIIGTLAADTEGTVVSTTEKVIPFETEIIFDNTLALGKSNEDQAGETGVLTETHTTKVVNGEVGDTVINSIRTKEPTNRIVRIGTKTEDKNTTVNTVVEETIPYDVIIEYDSNMEKGTSEVITEGVAGVNKVTYTTKLVNGVANGQPQKTKTEEITKKVDKVIKVGTKCPDVPSKEVNKYPPIEVDLDFDTRYVYDNSIEVGKTETIEGKKGRARFTTVEENGEVKTTKEIIQEPKTKIVKIGTKGAKLIKESEVEYGDIPVIEIPDSTLPEGETKVIQNGKEGTKRVVTEYITNEDGTLTEGKTTEVVTDPVSKIILVGTKKQKTTIPATPIEDIAKPIEKDKIVIPATPIEDIAKPIEKDKTVIPATPIEDIAKPIPGNSGNNGSTQIPSNPDKPVDEDDTVVNPAEDTILAIPHDTIVVVDSSLAEGETVLVLKGRDGEGIVDANGDVIVTKQPINEIIRVGAKNPEVNENVDDTDDSTDANNKPSDDDTTNIPNPDDNTENTDDGDSSVDNEDGHGSLSDIDGDSDNSSDSENIGTVSDTNDDADDDIDADSVGVREVANTAPKSSSNPKTGITGTTGVLSTLAVAMGALAASKKKEDDEDR